MQQRDDNAWLRRYRRGEPPTPTAAARAGEQAQSGLLEYRFLLAGADPGDAARLALGEELRSLIDGLVHLQLGVVNQGLQLEVEVDDIGPFDPAGFEAYLVDHLLRPLLDRDPERRVVIRALRSRHV